MTISILLMKQILSMILTMGCGYALVKAGLLKAEESHTISVLTIYVIFPCSVVNAFRIQYTPQIRDNFLLAHFRAGRQCEFHLLHRTVDTEHDTRAIHPGRRPEGDGRWSLPYWVTNG